MNACRSCAAPLGAPFLSLGASPVSNAYLRAEQLSAMEPTWPLDLHVCERCWLVQLDEFERADHIFGEDYAYFASFSASWLAHCKAYTELVTARFGLGRESFVVEVASNDGYLLQYFRDRSIPLLGIEPAASVANAAIAKGIPTDIVFFGVAQAEAMRARGQLADLLAANNVLAHNPNINDFVAGIAKVLKPNGVATLEFPHLARMLEGNQFDTIYHEHFSYLSLIAVEALFERHGLVVFDVDELPTHGGSLRIYAQLRATGTRTVEPRVAAVRAAEDAAGLRSPATYATFREQVVETKRKLLTLLVELKRAGKRIAGYGAPAKGNTLLNYCGIRSDFLDYTVDASPHKQGRFLPGSRLAIHAPAKILEDRPDYVLILPWNIKDEIIAQMRGISEWGGRFIVPIPVPEILGVRFTETKLAGAFLIELDRIEDDRGMFARTFCRREFSEHGLVPDVAQCNVSVNAHRHTLRGLHYQAAPHQEAKLVRCAAGAIYDVIVDLRPGSPTYRRWYAHTLTSEAMTALYIPGDFAHGFLSLTDGATVLYQMSVEYDAASARGVRWNDPALGIEWPAPPAVISDRDAGYPLLPETTHG